MSKKLQRMNKICQGSAMLKHLDQRARQLNQLNHILQSALPAQFVNHCELANVDGESLVLITDNAGYASMLRFQAPQLCRTLSEYLPKAVSKLEVKVRPKSEATKPAAVSFHANALSSDSAAVIQATAEGLESGALKDALEKLARRASSSTTPQDD
jgi:hypothetical protein